MGEEETARVWRELALGQWRVVAAADAGTTRLAAIVPLPKRTIAWETLSQRQRQVLALTASGASPKVIAADLGLTSSTVSEAFRTARMRLGFSSVAELMRAYEADRTPSSST